MGYDITMDPSKIVRLDGCYKNDVFDDGFNKHVEEVGLNNMDTPSLWVAPNSTLTAHRGTVQPPAQMEDIRPGVELGVVINSSVKDLDVSNALDAVGGFTVCMDLAAHDDVPGLEGYRMFDTCLPCGPEIVDPPDFDPETRALGIRVNSEPVDTKSTTLLRFSLGEILSYVSKIMSLAPGDLITTGSPIRGSPSLSDGDTVEAWIESVGTLEATIEWEK